MSLTSFLLKAMERIVDRNIRDTVLQDRPHSMRDSKLIELDSHWNLLFTW